MDLRKNGDLQLLQSGRGLFWEPKRHILRARKLRSQTTKANTRNQVRQSDPTPPEGLFPSCNKTIALVWLYDATPCHTVSMEPALRVTDALVSR